MFFETAVANVQRFEAFQDLCEPSAMNNISGLLTILPLQGEKDFQQSCFTGLENRLTCYPESWGENCNHCLAKLAQKLRSCLEQLRKSISVQIVAAIQKLSASATRA